MLRGVFIDGRQGRLFCTLRRPHDEMCTAVLVVPPFGEEMNKCRRMLTAVSKGLNAAGVAVLIPDLFGTGDSSGSFRDASWAGWVDDLSCIDRWAADERLSVQSLLAVRTGALLAAEFARARQATLSASVFWQPVTQGRTFAKQLLRIRAMASAVGNKPRETVEELVARMQAGESVEVAGYELTDATVGPLATLELATLLSDALGTLHVVETTRLEEKCGYHVEPYGDRTLPVTRYLGEPYWNATEIVCDANVVKHTVELLAKEVSRESRR